MALFAILIERLYILRENHEERPGKHYILGGIFFGLIYIALAVGAVLLMPPPHENPAYDFQNYFTDLSWYRWAM